ncbi:glucosaminidase domain-containing protein [Aerococcaceae bacterium NML190073]|nr:glucosaminidase domain-containing protein [Aerococcaceae bacterium NML190073]
MNNTVYETLIKLCTDICKRYGKKKLLWFADKDKSLNYAPKSDEMLITVHRWFANKSCPGNWLYARLGDVAARVTANLSGTSAVSKGTQASSFKNMSDADVIAKVGSLFTADQKKSGILASVSLAQFILESGYGKSELAQNANNCFGMKKSLSGNTWSGSTWDGKSIYTKKTQEEENGKLITITADFRKYSKVEDSIADHSAYLLGAKNGSALRYNGLKGCTDYKKAVQIIKDGGYATSSTYVSNLCSIIERWNLTKYDAAVSAEPAKPAGNGMTNADCPFLVRISINDLNIRKGAGTNYARTGKFTGKGVFTIMEVKAGIGSAKGWGRLKSGAGWIALDYAVRV